MEWKIPVVRVRDANGNIVEIPAIVGPRGPAGPGSGDMLASVYDTQGKRVDIYKYVDASIAAIPAAVSEADLTDMTATSFNGRTGDVVPQAGDYSAGMVGAYTKEETDAAIAAAIAEAIGGSY